MLKGKFAVRRNGSKMSERPVDPQRIRGPSDETAPTLAIPLLPLSRSERFELSGTKDASFVDVVPIFCFKKNHYI